MAPLIHLIQKDKPFSWGIEANNAFQFLKTSFTTGPVSIHANLPKPFVSKRMFSTLQ